MRFLIHAWRMGTSGKNWKTLLSLLLVRWQAVAFVVCEAIGLKSNNSADYIQLYSGDKETLTESLEHVQRASAEILAAISSSD